MKRFQITYFLLHLALVSMAPEMKYRTETKVIHVSEFQRLQEQIDSMSLDSLCKRYKFNFKYKPNLREYYESK